MGIPASSLPANLLREWRRPGAALTERWRAIQGEWDSPGRFVLVVALSFGLAILIPLLVVVLAFSSSPAWLVLLVPCAVAWRGMFKEFGIRIPVTVTREPAKQVEATPAKKSPAKPGTRSSASRSTSAGSAARRTPRTPSTRKPRQA
jgi:hypothetical protein